MPRKPLRASQSLFIVPPVQPHAPTLLTAQQFRFLKNAGWYGGEYVMFKPWTYRSLSYVCTSWSSEALYPNPVYADSAEAYLLVESRWPGAATSLSEKWVRMGMKRSVTEDPNGVYHGLSCMRGRYVLVGPPRIFLEGEAYWCESMRRYAREFDPTKDSYLG